MIQRIQTLFLIELIFLGLSLIFVPCQTIVTQVSNVPIYLLPLSNFQTNLTHLLAIILNVLGIVISIFTIFSFKKRELQVKLCYSLIVLWLILMACMMLSPFVASTNNIVEIQINYFVVAIGLFSVVAAYFAAYFIKKDINLLKSADRIR